MSEGGRLLGARRSPSTDGRTTRLTVGPRVTIESELLVGATGRVITINDGVMARLLSPSGESGRARRFELELPSIARRTTDRSTTSGRFDYVHEG